MNELYFMYNNKPVSDTFFKYTELVMFYGSDDTFKYRKHTHTHTHTHTHIPIEWLITTRWDNF